MYDSTLCDDWRALITFQQLIVLCDADGIVDITPQAIARRTNIPIEHIEVGIELLEAPDPYSRTPDRDGVRIERLDEHRPWGWVIVNHAKYKHMKDSDEVRENNRKRKALQRERDNSKMSQNVTNVTNVTKCHTKSHHTDTDTDTDTKDNPLVELKPDDLVTVFEFWQTTFNHPKAALDEKRKRFIKNALKHYSVDDSKKAICGCSNTPHNQGDNERGQKYDGIHIIFKDADQIDRFIANADSPPNGKPPKEPKQDLRQWSADGFLICDENGVRL